MKCQHCSLHILEQGDQYMGPVCKCWTYYAPQPGGIGCRPLETLTEAAIRQIIREELARAQTKD